MLPNFERDFLFFYSLLWEWTPVIIPAAITAAVLMRLRFKKKA